MIEFLDNPLEHGYMRCCGNTYDPRSPDGARISARFMENAFGIDDFHEVWLKDKVISFPMADNKEQAEKFMEQ